MIPGVCRAKGCRVRARQGHTTCGEHGVFAEHLAEVVKRVNAGDDPLTLAVELGIDRWTLGEVMTEARLQGLIPANIKVPRPRHQGLASGPLPHPSFSPEGKPACAGTVDPEEFYPLDNEHLTDWERRAKRTAAAFCYECPVRLHCLEWALEYGETGLWGGTTDRERRLIRRGELTRGLVPVGKA